MAAAVCPPRGTLRWGRLGVTGFGNRTAVGANVVGSETCEKPPSHLRASCAPDGRLWPDEATDDPELAEVIEAWPRMPAAARAGILAMVRALR